MAGGLKKGSGLFIQPQRITTEFDPRGGRRALLENDGSWTSYTLPGWIPWVPRGWAPSPTRGWWFLGEWNLGGLGSWISYTLPGVDTLGCRVSPPRSRFQWGGKDLTQELSNPIHPKNISRARRPPSRVQGIHHPGKRCQEMSRISGNE